MRKAFAPLLALLFCISAAADTWQITLADFRGLSGELKSIGPSEVTIQSAEGKQQIPWDDVAVLTREAPADQKSPYFLYFVNGQRLSGKPVRILNDRLIWNHPSLGELPVPLKLLRGFTREGAALPQFAGEANADRVILGNGDQLGGVLDGAEGGIEIQAGTGSSQVKWEDIRAVVLAQVAAVSETPANVRVALTDGSILLASAWRSAGEQLQLSTTAGDLRVALTGIRSVTNMGGRALYLAWLPPISSTYTPFTPSGDAPHSGVRLIERMALGPNSIQDVLALRPKSLLQFESPREGELYLRWACQSPGPLTDMTLEVQPQGAAPIHREHITSATPAEPLRVALHKGQKFSILVGYGANLDIQDELLLVQAAIISK